MCQATEKLYLGRASVLNAAQTSLSCQFFTSCCLALLLHLLPCYGHTVTSCSSARFADLAHCAKTELCQHKWSRLAWKKCMCTEGFCEERWSWVPYPISTLLCKYFLCITSHLKHCVYDGSIGCVVTEMFISRRIMKCLFLKKRKPSLLIGNLQEQFVQLQSLCPVMLAAYSLWMRCCAFITVQISDVALDRFLEWLNR